MEELIARTYWAEHGVPVTIARLFNTVGPRQTGRYGMVLPRFVAQAVAGEALTVYGDGSQTRCFCWVGDVVPALVGLVGCEGARGDAVNLGSTDEVTVAELAARVVQATGSSSEVVHMPYEEAYGEGFEEIPRRVPDITRARELIGFEPRTSLDEIIARLVDGARGSRSGKAPTV